MNGFSGTGGPVAVEGVSGSLKRDEHKRSSNCVFLVKKGLGPRGPERLYRDYAEKLPVNNCSWVWRVKNVILIKVATEQKMLLF